MKIVLRLLMVSILAITPIHAEGIPYNRETGKVEAPHTVLDLSPDQQEELEILGTITLTAEQWKSLRKVSPVTPKRITEIVPTDHGDCSCDKHDYAISLGKSRVAVIHGELHQEVLAWHLCTEQKLTLTVDYRGQFYYKGTLVPFATLLKALAGRPDAPESRNLFHLAVQLPLGMKRNDAVVKSRLDSLYQTATKAGWDHCESPPLEVQDEH